MLTLRAARLGEQVAAASERQLAERAVRIDALTRSLSHLDPRAVLERGYSIVRDEAGRIVRRSREVASGDRVDITFAEGGASARVERSE
jgi:exodeoxyribonuclease VII large subunit